MTQKKAGQPTVKKFPEYFLLPSLTALVTTNLCPTYLLIFEYCVLSSQSKFHGVKFVPLGINCLAGVRRGNVLLHILENEMCLGHEAILFCLDKIRSEGTGNM